MIFPEGTRSPITGHAKIVFSFSGDFYSLFKSCDVRIDIPRYPMGRMSPRGHRDHQTIRARVAVFLGTPAICSGGETSSPSQVYLTGIGPFCVKAELSIFMSVRIRPPKFTSKRKLKRYFKFHSYLWDRLFSLFSAPLLLALGYQLGLSLH